MKMKATRPGLVAVLVVVAALVTWPLLESLYGSLPRLPWTAVPTLLLLALGEAVTAVNVMRRIRRKPGTKPVEPMSVARMAALAKASIIAAALAAGLFGGFLLYLADQLDLETPREDFVVSVGTAVSALVLVGAGFLLEYACRVPKSPEDEENDEGASRT